MTCDLCMGGSFTLLSGLVRFVYHIYIIISFDFAILIQIVFVNRTIFYIIIQNSSKPLYSIKTMVTCIFHSFVYIVFGV